MELLWPDDVSLDTTRDGMAAALGGKEIYFFSRHVLRERPNLLSEHRAALTRHIMENGGDESVDILTNNVEAIISRQPSSVSTKVERLLLALAKLARFQVVSLTLTDESCYPLCREVGLNGILELRSLLHYLNATGLIGFTPHSGGAHVATTIPGLMHVEEHNLSQSEARTGFVAMWFNPEMGAAYSEGMAPAIEANGFEPLRIDRREHNNKIDDEIISEIRRSRFVVADFSCGSDGARGGVYFEAGFALALVKPVIFTVREADLAKVHFDTRQFNHIVWSDASDLMPKLRNRIAATIGQFGA